MMLGIKIKVILLPRTSLVTVQLQHISLKKREVGTGKNIQRLINPITKENQEDINKI